MRRIYCGLLACIILMGCQKRNSPVEDTRFLMDTLVRITAYSWNDNVPVTDTIDKVFELMAGIESRVSSHISSSEISQIVEQADKVPVHVSRDVIYLISESKKISLETHGLFDPTVGGVQQLWGFESEHAKVPDPSLIQSALNLVDFSQILINDSTVFLNKAGMRFDMGGVAKGYIIDEAVQFLIESGITSGIIDAGGDLRIFGIHPKRKTWRIAIRHPRSETMQFLAVLETEATAVATSGDYERYFVESGVKYHHILDPKKGYPARGCVSVTIVTDNALKADATATAVFVMGPEKGMEFIESALDLEGIIVYEKEDKLHPLVSSGLKQKIQYQ